MLKKKLVALVLAALTMLFAVGCGGEEELSMDPESMAVGYMKAFIECDTDAALDAANIDAIKDMLWYYSGDDYSYSEFEDMWDEMHDRMLAERNEPYANEMLSEEYGDDYFDGVESDGPADHDLYEDDFDEENTEIDELDAFDEFLDSEAVMQKEDNPNPDAAKEDMDDDEEEDDD